MADAGLRRRSAAELIAGRLAGSGLATPVAELVRAALEAGGASGLEAGGAPVYLGAIRVGEAELRLTAGPGLTVVAGAGRAGLADAVGRALAGDRSSPVTVEVSPVAVELSPVTVEVEPGMAAGLPVALTRDRPVLTRAELTALAGGSAEERYDALRGVLGLGVLVTAEEWLDGERREAEAAAGRVHGAAPDRAALLERLQGCPDERARAAEAILGREPTDLAALARLAMSDQEPGGPAGLWGQLVAVRLPGAEVAERAVRRLAEARQRVSALAGTPAEDARQLAGLVQAALEHVAAHPGRPCPLCRGRVLDERWVEAAQRAAGRLGRLAGEAEAIRGEAEAAAVALRTLVPRLPGVIEGAPVPPDAGLDFTAARAAWRRWSELAAGADAEVPASDGDGVPASDGELSEAERRFAELLAAVGELRKRAAGRLRERDEAWRPTATALAVWIEAAQYGGQEAERAEALEQAEARLRAAGREVTRERLAELARGAGPERADGTGAAQADGTGAVQADGTGAALADGAGLEVLLTELDPGERAGLGVELFLGGTRVSGGPFGFVVVDQPEEADAGRLARALERAAERIQVIVAARDEGLVAALGNAATVVELPG
jgi:hypothetical protein